MRKTQKGTNRGGNELALLVETFQREHPAGGGVFKTKHGSHPLFLLARETGFRGWERQVSSGAWGWVSPQDEEILARPGPQTLVTGSAVLSPSRRLPLPRTCAKEAGIIPCTSQVRTQGPGELSYLPLGHVHFQRHSRVAKPAPASSV